MGFQESLGLSNQQYFNVLMMFCELFIPCGAWLFALLIGRQMLDT